MSKESLFDYNRGMVYESYSDNFIDLIKLYSFLTGMVS